MGRDDRAGGSECGICAAIARLSSGSMPGMVAELNRSWVVLGDSQFYRGYCLILAKRHAREMHLMPREEAHELLDEILAVGAAIEKVARPVKLNWECLGNQEPHVHWHIFPRYADDAMRLAPVWERSERERKMALNAKDQAELVEALRAEILKIIPAARTGYGDVRR